MPTPRQGILLSSLDAQNAGQIVNRIGQNVHRSKIKDSTVDASEGSEAKVVILPVVKGGPKNGTFEQFTN
jgi:hypothetical protein